MEGAVDALLGFRILPAIEDLEYIMKPVLFARLQLSHMVAWNGTIDIVAKRGLNESPYKQKSMSIIRY